MSSSTSSSSATSARRSDSHVSSQPTYRTLAAPARAEIEVRRSRFRCDVAPVSTEEEARGLVEQVRSGTRDARHHCTAFVLGPGAATERSNDDGEPSGTAGAPMLEALHGRHLTDVVAVVTRWFGGTLLGTGGLIRAYGDAVTRALDSARVVTMELRLEAAVDVGHIDGPRVEHALRGLSGVAISGVDYLASGVRIHVATAPDEVDALAGLVAGLTSGAGRVTPGDPVWVRGA